MQNSPELDEEGYSIRPEEPGYILCCGLGLLAYNLQDELGFTERPLAFMCCFVFVFFPPFYSPLSCYSAAQTSSQRVLSMAVEQEAEV